MIIVIVPNDKRGKYVKAAAQLSGISDFEQDSYGNIKFEASSSQFEGILNISCIGTYKQPNPEYNMEVICLHLGETHYGQVWHSKEEYEEYKQKTIHAW